MEEQKGKENIYPPSFQAKLMLEEMPSTLASGMGSLIKRTDNQNINWKLDMNKGLGSYVFIIALLKATTFSMTPNMKMY